MSWSSMSWSMSLVSVESQLRGAGPGGPTEGAGRHRRQFRVVPDRRRPGADDAAAGAHTGPPEQVRVGVSVTVSLVVSPQ